jgi:cell division protein FtsB
LEEVSDKLVTGASEHQELLQLREKSKILEEEITKLLSDSE